MKNTQEALVKLETYFHHYADRQKEMTLSYIAEAIKDLQNLSKNVQENNPTSGNNYQGEVERIAEAITTYNQMNRDLGAVQQIIAEVK